MLRYYNIRFVLLSLILLLGLYLRLTMISGSQMGTPFRADALQYTAYAYNLKTHGIYSSDINGLKNSNTQPKPDAVRSPGYPFFLLLFTNAKQLDRFAFNVFYAQAFLSTITIALVYCLSCRIIGTAGAIISAFLTAISPHLITANIYVLTETLSTFFLIISFALLFKGVHSDKISYYCLSGVALAYATLVRPTIQYLLPFFLLLLFLDNTIKFKKRVSLSIIIPFAVLYSIWLIRNLIVIGSLSDPTLSINTLHHGMYPNFMFDGQPNTFGFPYRFDPASPKIAASLHNVTAEIVSRFISEPQKHIIWFISKPMYLFRWSLVQGRDIFVYPVSISPYDNNLIFKFSYMIMRLIHPIAIISSFIATAMVWLPQHWLPLNGKQLFTIRMIAIVYLYFIFVHIAGAPFPRYSIPIRPITYILASFPVYLFFIKHSYFKKTSIDKKTPMFRP